MSSYQKFIKTATTYLRENQPLTPTIGVILGSGLGAFVDQLKDPHTIDYENIPYFPVSTVVGHSGKLTFGKIGDRSVMVMQGRFHLYEGYSLADVLFPIWVMRELGIEQLIITTACGGLQSKFQAGDLLLITDVINFTSHDPLSEIMSITTDRPIIRPHITQTERNQINEIAVDLNIELHEGVFAWVTGPNYETRAEIAMLRRFADVVSMSTLPEWMAAHHFGLRTLAFACITNVAVGKPKKTTHTEVITTARQASEKLSRLLVKIIEKSRFYH